MTRCWLPLLCFAFSCTGGRVVAPDELVFGEVPAAVASSRTLQLRNAGRTAVSFSLRVEGSADFSVSPGRAQLEAGAEGSLSVTFTPRRLGPQQGTLVLSGHGMETRVQLSGVGVGAQLGVSQRLINLGHLPLVTGAPPDSFPATLTLSNTGTRGTTLQLSAPLVDSGEVCVGALVAGACVPWLPPAPLAPGERVELPLVITPTQAGPRTWRLTLGSGDPLSAHTVVEILAQVETAQPCQLEVSPLRLDSTRELAAISLHNGGASACFIHQLSVEANPVGSVRFDAAEARLEAGVTQQVWLRLQSPALRAEGTARVQLAGGLRFEVPFSFDVPPANCLVPSTPLLDFGRTITRCGSSARTVAFYNVCATPLRVTGVSTDGAEFVLVSTPAGQELPPVVGSVAGAPGVVQLRFLPRVAGPFTGSLRVSATSEGRAVPETVVTLTGLGEDRLPVHDDFEIPRLAKADVLVLIDSSPSFAPHRASVRDNLARVLHQLHPACIDAQFAFAAAETGAGFLADDAGTRFFSGQESGLLDRALAVFDAMPVGSETEACVGPAAALLNPDAGFLRASATSSVLCVTDALEQTPNLPAAWAALGARTTWSVVGAFTPAAGCAVESLDDGTHAGFVAATNGVRADLCDPSWSNQFPFTFTDCGGGRTLFYLNGVPEAGQVEVLLDGAVLPQVDARGQLVWSYDGVSNAVRFERAPAPGSTLRVQYTPQCW